MVVLDPNQTGLILQFLEDDPRKPFIHLAVAVPVLFPKDHPIQGHMTKRPEETVRIAVVVLLHFFFGEPDTSQRITRMIGWNPNTISLIHHLPITLAAAPGHPGPIHRLKQRVQRRRDTSRRALIADFTPNLFMNIGFPIGSHNQSLATQSPSQE